MTTSNRYLNLLHQSLDFSNEIGVQNINTKFMELKYQDKHNFQKIVSIVQGELFDYIESFFKFSPYLGNMCLDLSAITFMYLKAKGIDAEVIYGNVNINGSPEDEWNTTSDYLKDEFVSKIKNGEQDVHAWVGVGGDIIIDYALPERLWKNYLYPKEINFPVGYAHFFEDSLKVQYKPMLIGSDFFKQTNRYNPLDDIFGFKDFFKRDGLVKN